jgi:uncharacterized protein (TIGR03437 family)
MFNQQWTKRIHTFSLPIVLLLGLGTVRVASITDDNRPENNAQLFNVSAASYRDSALAPESIVAAFGLKLATTTRSADTSPLPTELSGTRVAVRDSLGVERPAPIFFVSPTQVNYLMPSGTANGAATVTITSGDGGASTGAAQIEQVEPGLFAADASGKGPAAGLTLRVKADGGKYFETVALFSEAQKRFFLAPIDFGPETGETSDQLFLVLFATGLRSRTSLSNVSATIGGSDAQVVFAGAHGELAGLDQINLRMPRSLNGRGEVEIALTVDGRKANPVRIAIGEATTDAYFIFSSPPVPETFVIRLTEIEKIRHARNLVSRRTSNMTSVIGKIVKSPVVYNKPWSYHVDPASIGFFESAIEVCDGAIKYIEEHLSEVGGDLLPGNTWCPWGSRLIKELSRSEFETTPPQQLQ